MNAAPNGHLLDCRNLHAYYGESYILHGVSLTVGDNEILALLGRNGAGKTTTLRTIARAEQPQLRKGEIYLRGQPLHGLPAFKAARMGVSLVPEDRRIIPGLTVEENLILAQIAKDPGWPLERIYEHFPRLAERRQQEGITLSGGEQQMLAIARALARDVSLLLLDEPYEGLAPQIVSEIEQILLEVKKAGMTVIVVEQNAVAALRIADRCAILDDGSVVFTGDPGEVLANEEIRREYLAL
ncbi:ABC transporter ATP-binding protein [Rhodospirillaceae bacterium SYSU D60014]|uniref:ABC transporter ATP-binding protein n=1 Tax=Virgifigura deserti TaxID=2268457 RepID=UPI000E663A72